MVILFLFNLLAESSMFFRILASALVALATVYYLKEIGLAKDDETDVAEDGKARGSDKTWGGDGYYGAPQGFSAEDGW